MKLVDKVKEKMFVNEEQTLLTDTDFISREIKNFKVSKKLKDMKTGCKYFKGYHDITERERQVIGANGTLETIENVPNNRIVNNQYKKVVDQKNNYLVGKPITFRTENENYYKLIDNIFNRRFMRLIKRIGEDSLNCGIGWLYTYYEKNELKFKRFNPTQIIAGWSDEEHTILEYIIRVYEVVVYEGKKEKIIEKVEVYDDNGVNYFEVYDKGLMFLKHEDYMYKGDKGFNWDKIPIIPFKYNNNEIPLINNIKSLQDGINLITSNFLNNMEEDPRNTILVLVNYDGENLGEFRKNIATYGAVKVRSGNDTGNGDVRTLKIEVNAENYKTILDILKKAIIENAMGYDAKDDRLGGTPNQMNILSMYSDIDLDANSMENEFQASFEELLWFFNNHFSHLGKGDFQGEKVDIIFNRDMLMNEAEIIENCAKSVGLLSDETIIANHPWTDSPLAEISRIKKQQEENIDDYVGTFSNNTFTDKVGD